MEGDNLIICPQHLFFRPFYDFYCHPLCLTQMRCQAMRSSTTPGTLGNRRTPLHTHEGHGSVIWRCFFCIFHHPLRRFLRYARLNTMTQCALIPDSSITASKIPKREEKGPHMTLLFSRTFLVDLLMVAKESPV